MVRTIRDAIGKIWKSRPEDVIMVGIWIFWILYIFVILDWQ